MIKYQLSCSKGHQFEAWFNNSAAFDRQAKRGLVSCADCGSTKVSKSIMAPQVARRDRATSTPVPAMNATAAPTAPAEMVEALRKLRAAVIENAENVGPKFAEEARKIHYKETEARGIYGDASPSDVKALHEEGIECYPLPRLPEDQN